MSKVNTFFNNISTVVNGLNTNTVKATIGDSVNNNRTLTVSQVIRYLTTRRKSNLKLLGNQLDVAYGILRPEIVAGRLSFRTDAIDINEFLLAFESGVVTGPTSVKRSIGRELAAA